VSLGFTGIHTIPYPLVDKVFSVFSAIEERCVSFQIPELQVLAGIAEVKEKISVISVSQGGSNGWTMLDKWFCDAFCSFCYFPTVNVSPESGMGL